MTGRFKTWPDFYLADDADEKKGVAKQNDHLLKWDFCKAPPVTSCAFRRYIHQENPIFGRYLQQLTE